jgi:uncharacterized protein YraI
MSFRRCLRLLSVLSLAIVLAAVSLGLAQEAVVTRNVNLRHGPSTAQAPIRLLVPPDTVELLEPNQTNGYYHVRTEDREEGWVWGRNVRILSEGEPAPTSPSMAPSAAPTVEGAAATAIAEDWEKPTPNQTTFQSEGKTCGPSGDGGDRPTNLLKNRTDAPGGVHDVTWAAIANLPYPSPAPKHRSDWTDDQLAVIRRYEGVAVRVIGYLVALKPQTHGSGESTNCHWTKSVKVDWHMALVKSVGDGEKDSIVIETTPRVRQSHPKWTPTRLQPWVNTDAPVRMTGWLMFDPEHRNHLDKYRMTLWEIHPITKIEVFQNGAWVDLDQLP